MPGRRANIPVDTTLCRRCQNSEPALTIRNEPLCEACFTKYVSTKVIKRMESFRVRHSEPGKEPLLLLPLSYGAGSIALLHLLSQHLKGQVEKTRRPGFKLLVLHVNETEATDDDLSISATVKQHFPEHTYISCLLSDVVSSEDVSALLNHGDAGETLSRADTSNEEKFEHFISSLHSATSRADAIQILKRRLIVDIAKQHECEAILWGHSTTKLAERTLAETAKGRGFALPWIAPDGETPYGIHFYYPMRDLLGKEIGAFASLTEPPLDELIVEDQIKPAVSTKNTTIDELMKQYFESVEREYPSIVANVVKTAGKLQAAPLQKIKTQCELCEMPLENQAPERSRLCYGCIRTLPAAVR